MATNPNEKRIKKLVAKGRKYIYPERIPELEKYIVEEFEAFPNMDPAIIEARLTSVIDIIKTLDKEHHIDLDTYIDETERKALSRNIRDRLTKGIAAFANLPEDTSISARQAIFGLSKLGPDFMLNVVNIEKLEREYGFFAASSLKNSIDAKIKENLKLQMTNMRKMDIPYYQVVKEALQKWEGLSEEEAEKVATTSSVEELENRVGVKPSMDAGINSIFNYFAKNRKELPPRTRHAIKTEMYRLQGMDEDPQDHVVDLQRVGYNHGFKALEGMIKDLDTLEDKDELSLIALSSIHDNWVKTNGKKFFARDSKFQHMPFELIGWEEAKKDLLFMAPVLESIGLSTDETKLEQLYNERVSQFLETKGIKSDDDLQQLISSGDEFYPSLMGQKELLESLNDPKIVSQIISQIKERGIQFEQDKDERTKKEETLAELIQEDDELDEELGDFSMESDKWWIYDPDWHGGDPR